jgi:LysM repeat protein
MTWKDNVLEKKMRKNMPPYDYPPEEDFSDDFKDEPNGYNLRKSWSPIVLAVAGLAAFAIVAGFFFLKEKQTAPKEPPAAFMPVPQPLQAEAVAARLLQIEKNLTSLQDIKTSLNQLAGFQKQLNALSTKISGLDKAMSRRTDQINQKLNALKTRRPQPPKQTQAPKKTTVKKAAAPAKPKAKKAPAKKPSVKARYHTVRAGETLFSISQKYGVAVATLRKYNNLTQTTRIYSGTKLLIAPGR